ncbi:hypothetical protein ATY36_01660 [Vibrio cidicii]|uniref:copper chaperone PCu(A)C n=1 Tax=Vibrio cidicii TaxID=1763883 RepID=UPI00077FF87C|nr:copper chaperone PCu(A)C [Vibrio cidicii]KYN81165.1 hypothetical protein ATY36_01660 [Vibrio cidicii]
MKLKALMIGALLLSPLAHASDVMFNHPYARAMAPGAVNSAVFVELVNNSAQAQTIVAASTPAAGKVELHDVIKQGDVMQMRQIEGIEVPANGKTELKPGSLHIMLFDLAQQLKEGSEIEVTVTFASGEKQTFTAPVKKVMAGMKHASH